MSLRTDFKDDVLDTTQNTNRVFNLKDSHGNIIESDVSLEDVTEYSQEGDNYGAREVNEQNETINGLLNPEFTSGDDVSVFNSGYLGSDSRYEWTPTNALASGDSHITLFTKISNIVKNVRTIAKFLGTTDMLVSGQSTITGAIRALSDGKVGTSDYRLSDAREPLSHASSNTDYGKGTNSLFGHLKLSNATNSVSSIGDGVAATPYAVNQAYTLASGKSNALTVRSASVTKSVTTETAWTVTVTQSGYTPLMATFTNNNSGAIITNIEAMSFSSGRAEVTGFATSKDGAARSTTFTVRVLWVRN